MKDFRLSAPLSLDLDDAWNYLRIRGDVRWQSYPSYLEIAVPRALDLFTRNRIRCTWFIIGEVAARRKNRELLAAVSALGHEIGNHSFAHEPWLHRYTAEQVDRDISNAQQYIEEATGQRPF